MPFSSDESKRGRGAEGVEDGLYEEDCARRGMREFQYLRGRIDGESRGVLRIESDMTGIDEDELTDILRYVRDRLGRKRRAPRPRVGLRLEK